MDANNIPAELRELDQWVIWKGDKKPRNPRNSTLAAVSDPSTWASFSDACQGAKDYKAGVGFVFTEDSPYCGVDLDKVIDDAGAIEPWAQEIIDKFDSYTEVSQSKHGIHILGRGKKPINDCRKEHVEIYDKGRYFALTGTLWQDRADLNDIQDALNSLCEETFGGEKQKTEPITTPIYEGGGRNNACTREAGRLLSIYKDVAVVKPMVLAYNQAVCVPPLDEKECASTWEKSLTKWAEKAETEHKTPQELRSLDEIEVRLVDWLWEPYIPLGKLTIMEGDPGEGKSWLSLAIATRVTLGELGGFANVLIASCEDDYDDTIRPRLEELGANLGFIYAIEEAFTLGSKKGLNDDAFEMLEKHLREKEPSLLIIDPLTAYLGSGVDMHRQNETRPVLARLAALARDYNCAILLIRHINKGGGTKAIYRGMGSIDFTASARSVLLAGHKDQEDGSIERALVHIKSNLAKLGPPIGYVLGHPFEWTTSELTANDILNEPIGGGKKTNDAEALIKTLLTDNESMPANEIFAAGESAGISSRTMRQAKKMLHVGSAKKDKTDGTGKEWHWYLPKGKGRPPGLEPMVEAKDGRIKVDLDEI